jgi:DNA polymerase I-like protein with 3'-5' exonuclease and polymerase domains
MIDFDVETTSLQWYDGEVFLAAFSDGQRDEHGELIVELIPIAEVRGEGYPPIVVEENRERVQAWLDIDDDFRAWNSKFDLHFLESMGFRLPPQHRWRDGMVEAQLINENVPNALKIRGERMGIADAKDPEVELKAWLAEETKRRRAAHKKAVYDWLEAEGIPQKRNRNPQVPAGVELPEGLRFELPNYSDVPWSIMEPYARQDIVLTRRIAEAFEGKIEKFGLQRVHDEIEMPVMGALYDMEKRGLPMDVPATRNLMAAASTRAEELHQRCVELAGGKSNFNPGSPDQVAEALKRQGADLSFVTKNSETGKLSMDEENLNAVDHPLADAVLAFRSEQKLLGNYLMPMFRPTVKRGIQMRPFLADDGRIHPNIRQVGARHGRQSCADPNLQNLPRDDLRLRWCVTAPPGKVLVTADMDQIEARVAAYYMSHYGGGRWLQELRDPDGDLHTSTANLVGLTGRQRSSGFESPRQQGKRYNYLKMFGGGARAIRKFLLVPQAHAKQTIERFEAAYPEFKMLDDAIQWRLAERRFITTLYGRRQRLSGPLREEGYKFLNYLISGTAADLLKVAINRLHAQGVPMVITVHDEIVAEVDEDDAERVAGLMEDALTDFPEVAEVVPLGAEAQIVRHWSEAKDPEFIPPHEQEAVAA